MKKIIIKDWFLKKVLVEKFEAGAYLVDIIGVERETEKAYLLKVEIGYCSSIEFVTTIWVPKSCTMSVEEYEAQLKKEADNFKKGCEAYEKLVAFAKANKVKGIRKGLRKETILKKIEEAGLSYTA